MIKTPSQTTRLEAAGRVVTQKSPDTFAGADNQIKLSVKFFFILEC
jgi:hypothetical protein